jgi:hypothetical protein
LNNNSLNIEKMLEEDRGRLTASLEQAETLEQAVPAAESEIDRLIYRYGALDGVSGREKDYALSMLRVLRGSLPLIDSAGEARVWERSAAADSDLQQEKDRAKSARWLSFGAVAIAVSAVIGVVFHPLGTVMSGVLPAAFSAAGGVFLYIAGRKHGPKRAKNHPEAPQKVEVRPDAARIYRYLHASAIQIDRRLEEIRSEDSLQIQSGDPAVSSKWTEDEIALFGDLLEASCSGSGEYALERLKELRYYLHRNSVELVDYSEAHADWFDVMPSDQSGTIRPAMVSGGTLLRKGLASEGGAR